MLHQRLLGAGAVVEGDGVVQDGPVPGLGNVGVGAGHQPQGVVVEEAAGRMAETLKGPGWDGEWFVRAYDAASNPVGSRSCAEGQIYIEPQGMCVMAGVGLDDGKAVRALDSVRERLLGDYGVELLAPCYTVWQCRRRCRPPATGGRR